MRAWRVSWELRIRSWKVSWELCSRSWKVSWELVGSHGSLECLTGALH